MMYQAITSKGTEKFRAYVPVVELTCFNCGSAGNEAIGFIEVPENFTNIIVCQDKECKARLQRHTRT